METDGLFALRELFEGECRECAFCENGRRKIFASASSNALSLRSFDGVEPRSSAVAPWDFDGFPIANLCLDPTGAWLLALSADALHIVPTSARLEPGSQHDLKWSITRATRLPLDPKVVTGPTCVVWWQTEPSESIAIIGDETGGLTFYSLDSAKIIRKTYIVGRICKLTIYFNEDSDDVVLLITSSRNRQWNLILEKRYTKENRPQEKKKGKDGNKKKINDLLESIKEAFGSDSAFHLRSKSTSNVPDKISSQTNNNNPTPITFTTMKEDDSKATNAAAYDGAQTTRNKCVITPQNSDGRHFISVFNETQNTFTLHQSIEDDNAIYSFEFKNLPTNIIKILWQQRVIYIFGKNSIEIHSGHFASQEDCNNHTIIWEKHLEDETEEILEAWSINETSNQSLIDEEWNDIPDIQKFNIPHINLGSCLIVSNKRTYILTTKYNPSEWLIKQIVQKQSGIERYAVALKIHTQPLLVSAANILLYRNNLEEALAIYSLAKLHLDKVIYHLGAFGFYSELLSHHYNPQASGASDICLLNHISHSLSDEENMYDLINFIKRNNNFSIIAGLNLLIDLGMWEAVDAICLKKGEFHLCFQNLIIRRSKSPCRGFLHSIINRYFVPFLVTDEALPLLKYIEQYSESFDNTLLKMLCVWMCPLQDCFRILYRSLSTGQSNSYLGGMKRVIRTFFGVASTLHSRIVSPKIESLLTGNSELNHMISLTNNVFDIIDDTFDDSIYPCVISCGHSHWGITNRGKVKLSSHNGYLDLIDFNTNLIGKVISISCGRDHTLILTENGLYALGSNQLGQLGVGTGINITIETPLLVGVMKKNCSGKNFAWYEEKIIQISAGQYHSACVTEKGILYTWGWGIHGQLGHGSIYNEFIPRRVYALNHEKITIVGCGSCHTAILTQSGSVYVCGNSAFGQIGSSARQKSNIPLKINIGSNLVTMIAVGYFHTLALLDNNEVWTWGSSPQKLRLGARSAKRVQVPFSYIDDDCHLYPTKVDTSNIQGKIIKMAAGWLHSCLVDDFGYLYAWGLNLDCQLGTGNRNEVFIPTMINIELNLSTENVTSKPIPLNGKFKHIHALPTVACGGDFTIFVNGDGKVFFAGNSCSEETVPNKGKLYFIKSKNATRRIHLPKPHTSIQVFKYVTEVDNVSEVYENPSQKIFKWPQNPIESLEDFEHSLWAHKILIALYQFIDDDTPIVDIHLRALLAQLRNDYAEALNLRLNSLYINHQEVNVPTYLTHSKHGHNENESSENTNTDLYIENVDEIVMEMEKRVNSLSRKYLNWGLSNEIDKIFCCQCDEKRYIKHNCIIATHPKDIGTQAILITKSILNSLPKNSNEWSKCINEAMKFWIDHGLNLFDLEEILFEMTVNGHTLDVATTVFCNEGKIEYQKHLSSNFNLKLCNDILQSW